MPHLSSPQFCLLTSPHHSIYLIRTGNWVKLFLPNSLPIVSSLNFLNMDDLYNDETSEFLDSKALCTLHPAIQFHSYTWKGLPLPTCVTWLYLSGSQVCLSFMNFSSSLLDTTFYLTFILIPRQSLVRSGCLLSIFGMKNMVHFYFFFSLQYASLLFPLIIALGR